MIKINENYLKLQASYLFAEIKNQNGSLSGGTSRQKSDKIGNWRCHPAAPASLYSGISPRNR